MVKFARDDLNYFVLRELIADAIREPSRSKIDAAEAAMTSDEPLDRSGDGTAA